MDILKRIGRKIDEAFIDIFSSLIKNSIKLELKKNENKSESIILVIITKIMSLFGKKPLINYKNRDYTVSNIPKFLYNIFYNPNKKFSAKEIGFFLDALVGAEKNNQSKLIALENCADMKVFTLYHRKILGESSQKMYSEGIGISQLFLIDRDLKDEDKLFGYNNLTELGRMFPVEVISMILFGEQNNALQKGIEYLIKQNELKKEYFSKIRNALIYPAIIIVMIFVIIVVIDYLVIDNFTNAIGTVPSSAVRIQKISYFLTHIDGWITILVCIFIGYQLKKNFNFVKMFIGYISVNFPIFKKIAINHQLMMFFYQLEFAEQRGLSIGLEDCINSLNNMYMKFYFKKIYEDYLSNSPKATFLNSSQKNSFYSPEILAQLKIGSENNSLGESFFKISVDLEKKEKSLMENINTIISPISIIFAGGLIAGLILPLFVSFMYAF